jgi:hypothetical protein
MVILDGPIHSSGRPTIAYGARGIVTLNLTVFGPKAGVHKRQLRELGAESRPTSRGVAGVDEEQRRSRPRRRLLRRHSRAPPAERALLDGVPEDSTAMLKTFGLAAPESAFPKLQDALQYPTLNVRGLASAHVAPAPEPSFPIARPPRSISGWSKQRARKTWWKRSARTYERRAITS